MSPKYSFSILIINEIFIIPVFLINSLYQGLNPIIAVNYRINSAPKKSFILIKMINEIKIVHLYRLSIVHWDILLDLK